MIPQAFTVFFWTLAVVIVFMIINEEKLLKIEAEYDRRKAEQKKQKSKAHGKTHGKNK